MSKISIIRPGELASLGSASPGFAHGFGIYETMRLREGRLEFWQAHWKRLSASAVALGIDCSFVAEEVLAGIRELASELPADGVIKLSLLDDAGEGHLLIYSRPLFSRPGSIGLVVDPSLCRLDERSLLAGHKTHNYAENILAVREARGLGCYDAARFNSKGVLAEAAMSNLMFLLEGKLCSPAESTGLLPGVVRRALFDGLDIEVGDFSFEELKSATSIYLTNSSVGVLPVDWSLCQGARFGLGSRSNPVFSQMQAILEARINEDAILL